MYKEKQKKGKNKNSFMMKKKIIFFVLCQVRFNYGLPELCVVVQKKRADWNRIDSIKVIDEKKRVKRVLKAYKAVVRAQTQEGYLKCIKSSY